MIQLTAIYLIESRSELFIYTNTPIHIDIRESPIKEYLNLKEWFALKLDRKSN